MLKLDVLEVREKKMTRIKLKGRLSAPSQTFSKGFQVKLEEKDVKKKMGNSRGALSSWLEWTPGKMSVRPGRG